MANSFEKLKLLKYELDKLDHFIEANLSIENLFSWSTDEADLLAQLVFIKDEKERIRHALMMEVASIEDNRVAEKFIRNHQTGLVYLANKVIVYKDNVMPKVGGYLSSFYLSFCNEIHDCLEFLLLFIEKFFSQYFDHDTAIAESHLRLLEFELTDTLIKFEQLPFNEADKVLCILVGSILQNRIVERLTPFTYRKAFYFREVINLVVSVPDDLEKELVYLNFNDPVFYKYCSKRISEVLLKKESVKDRILYMQFCIKEFKQLKTRPNFIYRLDCPNINQWLSEWLSEEILFHEKSILPIISMPPLVSDIQEPGKYELSLSVGQLGLLLCLFIDNCMPNHPAHKKIAMVIAKNFITKRAGKREDISWESLLGKFYKHDKATKDIVEEILLRMIKKIKEK